MSTPIFFDPQRKRWKRLRRVFDVLGVGITLLVVFFVLTILRSEELPTLLLPQQHRPYHALKEREKERKRPGARQTARRKSKRPPTQIVFNTDEGVRAAFYVKWDAGSFASLREYYPQIDLLFPEWLHVFTPDGRLQALTQDNRGRPADNR